MKKYFLVLVYAPFIFSQINYTDYFLEKSLRIDYYHTGNHLDDSYSLDEFKEEPYWGGSKVNLIDKFNYGKYKVSVYDSASERLLYSRTYSTLFSEWQTTIEAKKNFRTFSETVIVPFPKSTVRIEFYSRDSLNRLQKKLVYFLNPNVDSISPEIKLKYGVEKILFNGNPSAMVDIVILAEGYTKEQLGRFIKDCKKFADYLFEVSPYNEFKDKFNIWAVASISKDSGTDIPNENIWRNTILNSNFSTFGLDRYLMTSDNKTLRDLASNAPYDQIYILVNSDKYGGGAIYNHYAVSVNNNSFSKYVFIHELGHSFAFLADEYSSGDVAYVDFYPLSLEPLEPNLTTLVDFDSKWKFMVDNDTPVPTPVDKKYKNKIGAFEGGGYKKFGIYRPQFDCIMNTAKNFEFCGVCKDAIKKMILFYSN